MVLSWFQAAAASWDRAELAVQTKTTRGRRTLTRRSVLAVAATDDGMVGAQLDVAAPPVAFGADRGG